MTNILPVPGIFRRDFLDSETPRNYKRQKSFVISIFKSANNDNQIEYAEVHSIFILDVDNRSIHETTPDVYLSETGDQQRPFCLVLEKK